MNRIALFAISTAFCAATALPGLATAAETPDPFAYISTDAPGFDEFQELVERLDQQGAQILLVQRTFLGRVRILSTVGGKVRETVISPNTGEIRRDIIIGDYDPADYADNSGSNGSSAASNGRSAGRGRGNDNGRDGGSRGDRSGGNHGNGRGR